MTPEAYVFLAAALLGWAFVVVLSLGDVNLAERLRAERKKVTFEQGRFEGLLSEFKRHVSSKARRELMLLDDLDFACAEAVRLRERLDVLEARGLPDLAEMRAGGAV